ncbi:MAG: hypothetical protein FWC67_00710, partial [Defluviitaleaceae bacterium]|nr:hypothetical protein [Defluviitaleaceae bacterium]
APDEFNSRALRTNGQAFDFLLYASYEDLVEASKVSSQNVALDIIEGGVVVYAKESDIAG